jgi:hypothetical protein
LLKTGVRLLTVLPFTKGVLLNKGETPVGAVLLDRDGNAFWALVMVEFWGVLLLALIPFVRGGM